MLSFNNQTEHHGDRANGWKALLTQKIPKHLRGAGPAKTRPISAWIWGRGVYGDGELEGWSPCSDVQVITTMMFEALLKRAEFYCQEQSKQPDAPAAPSREWPRRNVNETSTTTTTIQKKSSDVGRSFFGDQGSERKKRQPMPHPVFLFSSTMLQ